MHDTCAVVLYASYSLIKIGATSNTCAGTINSRRQAGRAAAKVVCDTCAVVSYTSYSTERIGNTCAGILPSRKQVGLAAAEVFCDTCAIVSCTSYSCSLRIGATGNTCARTLYTSTCLPVCESVEFLRRYYQSLLYS